MLRHGLILILGTEGAAFPFILVSPQCPADAWWTEQPVFELVDHLEKTDQNPKLHEWLLSHTLEAAQ